MTDSTGRIAISGLGVVTPLGVGLEAFWHALATGQTAVKVRPFLSDTRSPYRIAATIDDFDGKHWIKPRKAMKVMSPPIQFGCAAAQMAIDLAGFQPGDRPAERIAVVVGANSIYADPPEMAPAFAKCRVDGQWDIRHWGQEFPSAVPPLWMLQYLPNMAAAHISIGQDARGPSNSICQENCSSLLAMIESALLLQRGWADVALAGGTGSLTSLTGMIYRGPATLTTRIDEAHEVPCPFDINRDGQVIGEGAGMLFLSLESGTSQTKRFPRLGYISGWARGFCPPDSVQSPLYLAKLIGEAMSIARLKPSDLGHVNAHAAGLPEYDRWEAQAIAAMLGDTPVIAWKSYFGNLGAGSGAVELVASLLCWQHQCLLPTRHLQQLDPDCPIQVLTQRMDLEPKPFLKISLDPTGQMVVLVVEPANCG